METDSTTATANTSSVSTGYAGRVRSFLARDDSARVSEEELFAGILGAKIAEDGGEAAAAAFDGAFGSALAKLSNGRSGVAYEDAAKEALGAVVSSGAIEQTIANELYSHSFAAAQLDGDSSTLFDGFGGANDPTVALATLADAIRMMETKTGDSAGLVTRDYREPSNQATSGAINPAADTSGLDIIDSLNATEPLSQTFLYKPISESDGNLVILPPAALAGRIESVSILDKDGNTLEEGTFNGNGNGGRDHFRFSKPGNSYPGPATVEIRLAGGQLESYQIDNTGKRVEE